jgi:hypothetical protein
MLDILAGNVATGSEDNRTQIAFLPSLSRTTLKGEKVTVKSIIPFISLMNNAARL